MLRARTPGLSAEIRGSPSGSGFQDLFLFNSKDCCRQASLQSYGTIKPRGSKRVGRQRLAGRELRSEPGQRSE
eukprot:10625038-Alexandrium_andersonii.AAC.1